MKITKCNLVSVFLLMLIICTASGCDHDDPILQVDEYSVKFSSSGGSKQIEVTSNLEWRISGADDDWLTVSPTYGTGSRSIRLTAAENKETSSKKSSLILQSTNGRFSQTIDVTLEGAQASLGVSTNSISLVAAGESKTFQITSNTSWTISGYPSWLTVSPSNGNGNQSIAVTATENTSTEPRSCNLTVNLNGGAESKTITINQSGKNAELLVNGTTSASLNFGSAANETQSINVTANVNWNIMDIPDWIRISPSNGSGNSTINITVISENNASSERSAKIRVASEKTSAYITVKQASGKPVCYIEPTNLTALYNQICFDLKATPNVNTFVLNYFTEYEIQRYTENEIIELLSSQEPNKYFDDYIFFPSGFEENTTYYICSIAFDEKGRAGELVKTPIKTLPYVDYDQDAYVSLSDVAYGDSGFTFTCTKEAYCDSYHLIYGNLLPEYADYPKVLYAFEINYYMKHSKKHWFASNWELEIVTNYPNSHTFYYTTYLIPIFPLISIYGWGVFKNGQVSSDMVGLSWDTSSSDVKEKRFTRPERRKSSNCKIEQGFTRRALEIKKKNKK